MRFAFTYNKSEREGTLYKETRIKVLNQSDESWDHVNTCDVKFDIDGRNETFLECASSKFSTFAVVTKPKVSFFSLHRLEWYLEPVLVFCIGGRVQCWSEKGEDQIKERFKSEFRVRSRIFSAKNKSCNRGLSFLIYNIHSFVKTLLNLTTRWSQWAVPFSTSSMINIHRRA